jgi:hypothetical protein
MPGSLETVDMASSGLKSGSLTMTGQVQQIESGASIPCKRIRLMAPVSTAGTATNAAPIFFGFDSTNQKDWIAADGSRDTYLHVDNSKLLYLKGVGNDVINYRVE